MTSQICAAVMKVPGDDIQEDMTRTDLLLTNFPGDDKPGLSVLIGSDYYWPIVSHF